jgi:YhcH/YjgK/YiaL family protein
MKNKPVVIEKAGMKIMPDTSVDNNEFDRWYSSNPGRWDSAFSFLREADLQNLAKGKHEIEGKDLYAIVDEYTTRDEAETRFEAHRDYADIQYIISGKELIGIAPITETTVSVTFDTEKDICFLDSPGGEQRLALPDRYFIFFPSDAHRPCMKAGNSIMVKKIVLKVRIEP